MNEICMALLYIFAIVAVFVIGVVTGIRHEKNVSEEFVIGELEKLSSMADDLMDLLDALEERSNLLDEQEKTLYELLDNLEKFAKEEECEE